MEGLTARDSQLRGWSGLQGLGGHLSLRGQGGPWSKAGGNKRDKRKRTKGKEVSALSYLQGPDTGVRPFGAQGNNSGNSPLPSVEHQREGSRGAGL